MIDLLVQLDHDALLASLALLCFPGAWLGWLVAENLRHRRHGLAREAELLAAPLPPDRDLPHVLVQIPTFNEPLVIRRIVEAVGAFDWPRDKLHLQVVDDSTDETTEIARDAIARLRAGGLDAVLLHRRHRDGFKAGALKEGLRRSDHPFVAIFDADFLPRRDFLRLMLRPLLADPRLAFVQARWECINADHNALTRAQRVIIDAQFAVEEAAKLWSVGFAQFSGSCGVWRRAAIEDAGGWRGDTLSEDVDLSYRALIRGWRAQLLTTVSVPGEVPDNLEAWRAQQARWTKGFAQLARKHLLALWRSDLDAPLRAVAAINLLVTGFGPLTAIALLSAMIEALSGGLTQGTIVLAAIAVVANVASAAAMGLLGQYWLHDARAAGGARRVLAAMSFFVYAHVLSAKAVLDGLRGRASIFVRTPKKGAIAELRRDDLAPSAPVDHPGK